MRKEVVCFDYQYSIAKGVFDLFDINGKSQLQCNQLIELINANEI